MKMKDWQGWLRCSALLMPLGSPANCCTRCLRSAGVTRALVAELVLLSGICELPLDAAEPRAAFTINLQTQRACRQLFPVPFWEGELCRAPGGLLSARVSWAPGSAGML